MVDTQIKPRGIDDAGVLSAMRKVPRERFVEEKLRNTAYEDRPLPIGEDQTISQPFIVALMTMHLKLHGGEKVLEIGTGCGYQTAILAELGGQIYSVERHIGLAQKAGQLLEEMGYGNVKVFAGDGTEGLEKHAPYQRIMVTAAAPVIPSVLVDQLDENGVLVVPVGSFYSQDLKVIEKKEGRIFTRDEGACVFVPLIGKYGWHKNDL